MSTPCQRFGSRPRAPRASDFQQIKQRIESIHRGATPRGWFDCSKQACVDEASGQGACRRSRDSGAIDKPVIAEDRAGEHEVQCLIMELRVQNLPETLPHLAMKAEDCVRGLDVD